MFRSGRERRSSYHNFHLGMSQIMVSTTIINFFFHGHVALANMMISLDEWVPDNLIKTNSARVYTFR